MWVVATPNGPVHFGENHPLVVVAGPCSVENEEMIVETARRLSRSKIPAGGAYKPRTSPYAFQGHGESAPRFAGSAQRPVWSSRSHGYRIWKK